MTSRVAGRLVAAAFVAQRIGEVRYARRNEAAARAAGAVEHGASHYPAFFVLHPAWLLGLLVESASGRRGPRWSLLGVAALTNAVRVATMRALGPQWTTRILITPGTRRVTGGPYRVMRDPAYAAVTVELAAVPLAVRAPRTALASGVANALLLGVLRIPAERRAEATRTA